MIDYGDDGALSMAELSLEGVNELYAGDLVRQEKLDSYRLTRDRNFLIGYTNLKINFNT